MSLDLYHAGVLLGSVVRSAAGAVYARCADGAALGTFGDIDAAVAALMRRQAA